MNRKKSDKITHVKRVENPSARKPGRPRKPFWKKSLKELSSEGRKRLQSLRQEIPKPPVLNRKGLNRRFDELVSEACYILQWHGIHNMRGGTFYPPVFSRNLIKYFTKMWEGLLQDDTLKYAVLLDAVVSSHSFYLDVYNAIPADKIENIDTKIWDLCWYLVNPIQHNIRDAINWIVNPADPHHWHPGIKLDEILNALCISRSVFFRNRKNDTRYSDAIRPDRHNRKLWMVHHWKIRNISKDAYKIFGFDKVTSKRD